MVDDAADPDATGVIGVSELRLAEFLKGDPPLPNAILLVVSGDARGEILAVTEPRSIVGRVVDADLMIDDSTVSRRHALLRVTSDGLELEDLGSSNGTTMNGNRIEGTFRLADGDLVGFGSATALVKRIT